jgi:hypothetical protein
MGFIKNWFIKRALRKMKEHSSHEKTLDEELAETSKNYLDTLRQIEKQNKVFEAKRRINELNRAQDKAQKKLLSKEDEEEDEEDEDYEEEDEEDEFTQFLTDMAKKAVMSKINPTSSASIPQFPMESSSELVQTPLKSMAKSSINQVIDKLSDEQIEKLVKDYMSRK